MMALNHNVYGGVTLKALLENPDLQNAPTALSAVQSAKDKTKGHHQGSGDIDFTSAFLGPQLWSKPYDGSRDFNLEYMDLDEFLTENGIPVVNNPNLESPVTSPTSSPPILPQPTHVPLQMVVGAQEKASANPLHSPSSSLPPNPFPPAVMTLAPTSFLNPEQFLAKPKVEPTQKLDVKISSPGAQSTGSTSPVSPLPVQVDFSMNEQDIALSSVPGQGIFDPTTHVFDPEELKPQPMIKKSRKVSVPEELKDEKYWARRRKNNFAAKRSRDAKRVKENQIAMRAAYLEKENSTLKEEMDKVLQENVCLKHRLSKYESTSSCT